MNMPRYAGLLAVDHAVLRGTRRVLGDTPAVPAARALSLFGEHGLGWLAVGGVGLATGRCRADWSRAVLGTVAAHAAGVAVKHVVRRARPSLHDVPPLTGTLSGHSFPSAHSCSTAAAAVGFAPLVGGPVMAGLTFLMLTSRVLLGVHYPSDVVSGAALGAAVAAAVRRLTDRRVPEA